MTVRSALKPGFSRPRSFIPNMPAALSENAEAMRVRGIPHPRATVTATDRDYRIEGIPEGHSR